MVYSKNLHSHPDRRRPLLLAHKVRAAGWCVGPSSLTRKAIRPFRQIVIPLLSYSTVLLEAQQNISSHAVAP
jgi:hypothetical protein